MSNNMQGMDTEYMRTVANEMGENAGQVAGICERLLARVQATSWTGPDKEGITNDISGSFLPNARACSDEMHTRATDLHRHCDAQDAASA